MMNKRILSVILSIVLLICITACKSKEDETTTGGDTPTSPPATQTVYQKLDGFADAAYQKIKLDIVTTVGDVQLSASYTMTQSNVSYRIEQLNTLPLDGDLTGVSPEYQTTHTGTAKIVNGKVTEFDGKKVTLPSYDELKGNFNFKESNFKNVVTNNNSFKADVISPSVFYGSNVSVQNMKVHVEYTEEAFSKITVTYQTAHATVVSTYDFTN